MSVLLRVLNVCVCTILERLVANITTVGTTNSVREASLQAIGYICQDIVSVILYVCLFVGVIFISSFCCFELSD